MKVLFIDDDANVGFVNDIIDTLEKTGMLDCDFVSHFSKCGTTREQVIDFIRAYDFLVLDVLMEVPSEGGEWSENWSAFRTFIGWIGQERPFVAYTQLDAESVPDRERNNFLEVGELVHANGGLCVITKNNVRAQSDRANIRKAKDLVCEKVLSWYWTVRGFQRLFNEQTRFGVPDE